MISSDTHFPFSFSFPIGGGGGGFLHTEAMMVFITQKNDRMTELNQPSRPHSPLPSLFLSLLEGCRQQAGY